jgi:hypothetical protein
MSTQSFNIYQDQGPTAKTLNIPKLTNLDVSNYDFKTPVATDKNDLTLCRCELMAPPGFESFQGHLQQCFLNCIARKNAMNMLMSTADKRKKAIIGALQSVLNKALNNTPIRGTATIEEYSAAAGNVNLQFDLQKGLAQCFLNCIARKNFIQKAYNKSANYTNKNIRGGPDDLSSKKQRRTAIINALTNIINKAKKDKDGLAKYVLTSFKDAGMNYINNVGNATRSIGTLKNQQTRGGKYSRKSRKAKKSRKARNARKARHSRK